MTTPNLYFCTLFDSHYLPRGLNLIDSLLKFAPTSRIWVLCMDDECYRLLTRLNISAVTPIPYARVNSDELKKANSDRTQEEICWTSTPIVCEHVLELHPELPHVIYVDADVKFLGDPSALLAELGEGAVLIFEHGFPPDQRSLAEEVGRFNVEIIVFCNDNRGRKCLAWWRDRCIEWCYHRVEPGRMGDQKYLDDWPELFEGVVIASEKSVGLAPWNWPTYALSISENGTLLAYGWPVLFVHFSKLTMYWRGQYRQSSAYPVPRLLERHVYKPYKVELDRQWDRLRSVDPAFSAGLARPTIGDWAREAYRLSKRFASAKIARYRKRFSWLLNGSRQ